MAMSLGRSGAVTLMLCLLLASLTLPADARMRRPWESDEEYAHNDKHKIPNRTPPKGWGRPGSGGARPNDDADEVPAHLAGLTEEARGHCMKDGHQCDKAERSAACVMGQHGFLQQVAAVKAAGYITAQDLVDSEDKFTDAHLQELGFDKLMHRKKFVGKVLHYAKKAAAPPQKDEV